MFRNSSIILVLLVFTIGRCAAQELILSGPMQGYIEYRTAQLWVEVSDQVNELTIRYHKQSSKEIIHEISFSKKNKRLVTGPFKIELTDLNPNQLYQYSIIAATTSGEKHTISNSFKTRANPPYDQAPDISFITGSCAYFPDKKNNSSNNYLGSMEIFKNMSETKADFMLWLGDNWYTLEQDYHSSWGLMDRAGQVRRTSELQPLLANMPNYAIWDDHDFGPNNAGSSYILKDASREVFKKYWCNPSYGEYGKGIYTMFQYYDITFILLDDRTWRSSDNMKDSVKGEPNTEKTMFGSQQMKWLKDVLLQSNNSSFKIIATGSQMLNTYSPFDCFYHFPAEFNELTKFISDNDIKGIVFLTGDRHHSEVLKYPRKDHYTLYEMTVSPLTSRLYNASEVERNMPTKVLRVEGKHNYAEVSINGNYGKRQLTLTYYDDEGNEIQKWSVLQEELRDQ